MDTDTSWAGTAREIGERVAGPAADDVDAMGRDPAETVAELRALGLLAALVSTTWGGPVLATARRAPDSPPHERVLAVCLPPTLSLVPDGEWDTLGLRGTRSRPARLSAELSSELIIGDCATAFARTTLPVSAILLGSVWLGIAEAAARRAHASVRAAARRQRAEDSGGGPPTSALRLAELSVALHQMRAVLGHGAAQCERVKDGPEVETLTFSSQMDSVKIATSTLVGDVVRAAMAICGMSGYANQSPVSIARLSRDAAAAPPRRR